MKLHNSPMRKVSREILLPLKSIAISTLTSAWVRLGNTYSWLKKLKEKKRESCEHCSCFSASSSSKWQAELSCCACRFGSFFLWVCRDPFAGLGPYGPSISWALIGWSIGVKLQGTVITGRARTSIFQYFNNYFSIVKTIQGGDSSGFFENAEFKILLWRLHLDPMVRLVWFQ